MSKPYWSGPGSRTGNGYLDDIDDSPIYRTGDYSSADHHTGFYRGGGYRTTDEYRAADTFDDDYDDYDDYDDHDGPPDNRWRWVAGLAVAVLLVAVIATTMVMRSDSTSSTAQSETAPPATSTAPRTVIATVPPSAAPPPPAQLSPETVVTITTTPSAVAPPEGAPPAPPEAAPPAPATRTITYSVTGTRQLFDLVSIIYTDEQGLPRTDVNVALPWSRTVVLNPGVDFESVTATSVTGQLNCAITDAAGAPLVTQANNSMIATCTG